MNVLRALSPARVVFAPNHTCAESTRIASAKTE